MKSAVLFLVLAVVGTPALAKPKKTYPASCDRVWAAVKQVAAMPDYEAELDDMQKKGTISTGSASSGRRIYDIALTGNEGPCTVAVGNFSGLFQDWFNNDRGDLFKRIEEVLGPSAKSKLSEPLSAPAAKKSLKTKDEETMLLAAAEQGHVDVVEASLTAKADVNARDKDGYTALMGAALYGHQTVVERLLGAGADLNAKTDNGATAGATSLHLAAQEGHADVVKTLLAAGADVNAKRRDRHTPLMQAAYNGRSGAVGALIAAHADVNARGAGGSTALIAAADRMAFASSLPELPSLVGVTVTHPVDRDYPSVVKQLIAAGADVNAKKSTGETALMLAADNGDTEIVQILLGAHANVNAKGPRDATALLTPAANGHLEIVKALLAVGANVNARGPEGITPLQAAIAGRHVDIVEALLAAGADPNIKSQGRTALKGAKEMGFTEIVELLEKAGAKD